MQSWTTAVAREVERSDQASGVGYFLKVESTGFADGLKGGRGGGW